MILFQNMTEADFTAFKEFLLEDYAQDLARNYRQPIDEARANSANQINRLLEQGVATPSHHLFNLVVSDEPTQPRVGYLWVEVDEQKKRCFIYDIYLEATYRGRGYGTQTLQLLETKMREQNIAYIGLHVFAHNTAARELYSKLGYQVAGVNMQKWLAD